MRPFDPEKHNRNKDGRFAPMDRAEVAVNLGGEMATVVSHWVRGAAFDPTTGTATFNLNGKYYSYEIPEETFLAVIRSDSPGKAYNELVKGKDNSAYAEKCDLCGRWYIPTRDHECRMSMLAWMRDDWMKNSENVSPVTQSGAPRNWTADHQFIRDIEHHASPSHESVINVDGVGHDTAAKLLGNLPLAALNDKYKHVTTKNALETVVASEGVVTANGRVRPPSQDDEGLTFTSLTVHLDGNRKPAEVLKYLKKLGLRGEDPSWLGPPVEYRDGVWTVDLM